LDAGRGFGRLELGFADQERGAASRANETNCDWQDGLKAFDGTKSYSVGPGGWEVLGTGVYYIDVCQCKDAKDFAEEGRFLLVGLDQGSMDFRRPDFYGEGGESSTGSYVEKVMGGGFCGMVSVAASETRRYMARGGTYRFPAGLIVGEQVAGGE